MNDIKNKGKLISFKKQKKAILKQKKREEKIQKFKDDIKSDYEAGELDIDEYEIRKAFDTLTFSEKTNKDIQLKETTIEKLENKFQKQENRIFILVFLLLISIAFIIFAHLPAKSQVAIENYMSNNTKTVSTVDFDDTLYGFTIDEVDKLKEFLNNIAVEYTSTMENFSNGKVETIKFTRGNYDYVLSIDYNLKYVDIFKESHR